MTGSISDRRIHDMRDTHYTIFCDSKKQQIIVF